MTFKRHSAPNSVPDLLPSMVFNTSLSWPGIMRSPTALWYIHFVRIGIASCIHRGLFFATLAWCRCYVLAWNWTGFLTRTSLCSTLSSSRPFALECSPWLERICRIPPLARREAQWSRLSSRLPTVRNGRWYFQTDNPDLLNQTGELSSGWVFSETVGFRILNGFNPQSFRPINSILQIRRETKAPSTTSSLFSANVGFRPRVAAGKSK